MILVSAVCYNTYFSTPNDMYRYTLYLYVYITYITFSVSTFIQLPRPSSWQLCIRNIHKGIIFVNNRHKIKLEQVYVLTAVKAGHHRVAEHCCNTRFYASQLAFVLQPSAVRCIRPPLILGTIRPILLPMVNTYLTQNCQRENNSHFGSSSIFK